MDYEIFCDSSYYDMWCVRPKGSTSFNDPRNRHFSTEEEAMEYKELVDFACYLSGHDEDTIRQMYGDWKRVKK